MEDDNEQQSLRGGAGRTLRDLPGRRNRPRPTHPDEDLVGNLADIHEEEGDDDGPPNNQEQNTSPSRSVRFSDRTRDPNDWDYDDDQLGLGDPDDHTSDRTSNPRVPQPGTSASGSATSGPYSHIRMDDDALAARARDLAEREAIEINRLRAQLADMEAQRAEHVAFADRVQRPASSTGGSRSRFYDPPVQPPDPPPNPSVVQHL